MILKAITSNVVPPYSWLARHYHTAAFGSSQSNRYAPFPAQWWTADPASSAGPAARKVLFFAISTDLWITAADCECGYSLNSTSSDNFAVFTDVLESDFTTLTNITEDTDWVPQKWQVNAKKSKGPFGRDTDPANAISNPLAEGETRKGENGGDAGLELWVRKVNEGDDMVGVSEVDSKRTDMLYGTFRAGFQLTPMNGTCAAFFW